METKKYEGIIDVCAMNGKVCGFACVDGKREKIVEGISVKEIVAYEYGGDEMMVNGDFGIFKRFYLFVQTDGSVIPLIQNYSQGSILGSTSSRAELFSKTFGYDIVLAYSSCSEFCSLIHRNLFLQYKEGWYVVKGSDDEVKFLGQALTQNAYYDKHNKVLNLYKWRQFKNPENIHVESHNQLEFDCQGKHFHVRYGTGFWCREGWKDVKPSWWKRLIGIK